MRQALKLFGAFLTLACSDGSGPTGIQVDGPVTLRGVATYDRPLAGQPVVLEHVAPDGSRTVMESAGAETADDGSWAYIPSTVHAGAFEIRIGALRRYVVEVPFESSRDHLVVSPVTTWSAVLADHLQAEDQSLSLEAAVSQAEALIHEHFGGPQTEGVPRSLAETPVESLAGAEVQMGLVLDGLRELAHEHARIAGVSADGEITLQALTELLAQDLRDGVFDGQGPEGQLAAAGVPLSGDTLRASYAMALRRFMDGDRNLSRFTSADVARWTEAVATRRSAIFPPDPPAPLDVLPPELTFDPADGALLQGTVDIAVNAQDMSPLALFEITQLPDEAELLEQAAAHVQAVRVRTDRLPDGLITVSARALDVHDNLAAASATYRVDNTPPEVAIEANFAEDESARGTLEVRALAVDFSEIASLTVTWPDGTGAQGARQIDGNWSVVAEWDSTAVEDGVYAVTVEAVDVTGLVQRVTRPVELDNVVPGAVAGEAHWDSPISGLALAAYALTAEGVGPRVDLCAEAGFDAGCTTDDDGAFRLRLSDVYEGPVLLRASPGPDGATRFDAATAGEAPELGALVPFEGQLEVVIRSYTPGATIEPVYLSPVTTLAAAWGQGAGGDPAAAHEASLAAWGRHFCPLANSEAGCDPSVVRPAAFGVGPIEYGAGFPQGQLGLVAAGLSMQAQLLNEAHRIGYRPETYLATLARDLSDGVIDRAVAGELLYLRRPSPDDPNPLQLDLSKCALRGQLASGIAAFLRRPALNRSPVRLDAGTNGWLHHVATEAVLWQPDDQLASFCPYDNQRPTVEIAAPARGLVFGPEGPHNAGPYAFTLRLQATDDIALQDLQVDVRDGVELDVIHADPGDFHATVHFEGAGAFDSITVRAVDWVGNETEVVVPVIIDLEPPGETTLHNARWRDFDDGRHLTIFGNALEYDPDEPIPVRDTTIPFCVVSRTEPIFIHGLFRTGTRGPEHLGGQLWAATVEVPVQFGENLISFEVGDLYGNRRPVHFSLIRDEIGPSLRLENTTFVDAGDLVPTGRDCDPTTGLCETVRFNVNDVEPTVVTVEDLANGSATFRRFAGNWGQELFAVHPNHQPRIDLVVTDPFDDHDVDYRVLVAQRPAAGGEPINSDYVERRGWGPLQGEGERQSLPITPATIPGLETLASNEVVRVEFQTRNRAERRATLAAHFSVRHLSPPLTLGEVHDWKRDGNGLGVYRFGVEGAANVLNLCNVGGVDGFRMTRALVHNPWPFDAHVRLQGGLWVRQYNRLAWRGIDRRIFRGDACQEQEWRYWDSDSDRECRATPEQVTGQRWSAWQAYAERHPMSVRTTDGSRLQTLIRGGLEYIVVPAGRTVDLALGVSACDPPFIPDPAVRGGRVDERHAGLGRDMLYQAGYYADRYTAVARVAALDFELTEARPGQGGGVRLSWYADIESAQPGRYDAAFHDTWRIAQQPLSMPEGQERRD